MIFLGCLWTLGASPPALYCWKDKVLKAVNVCLSNITSSSAQSFVIPIKRVRASELLHSVNSLSFLQLPWKTLQICAAVLLLLPSVGVPKYVTRYGSGREWSKSLLARSIWWPATPAKWWLDLMVPPAWLIVCHDRLPLPPCPCPLIDKPARSHLAFARA